MKWPVIPALFLAAVGLVLGFTSCANGTTSGDGVPEWATGFHNFPTGRVTANGMLTITSTVNNETLLFHGTVEPENYIGTVLPLGSVRVTLPEQRFYTIIAVDKESFIERRTQAAQSSILTYFSTTQPYNITVTPRANWGGGNWVFNNHTNFWVEVKTADLSQNHAVIAPNALRVTIPLELNEIIDYRLVFHREIRIQNVVMALAPFEDITQADTFSVTNDRLTQTTDIRSTTLPSTNIRPFIMVHNNWTGGVRVFRSGTQMTNGAPSGDFVVNSGSNQLITGFENGDLTNAINFRAMPWGEHHRYVPTEMTMERDKVYVVTIPVSGLASEITVTVSDASDFFD